MLSKEVLKLSLWVVENPCTITIKGVDHNINVFYNFISYEPNKSLRAFKLEQEWALYLNLDQIYKYFSDSERGKIQENLEMLYFCK